MELGNNRLQRAILRGLLLHTSRLVLYGLPAFLLLLYFYLVPANLYYPQSDSVRYLETALSNGRSIHAKGLWSLPYVVFMERGERRTATAIPATLAAVLFGDDISRAQACANLAMFTVLMTYMYCWVIAFFSASSRAPAFWFLSLQPFLLFAASCYMSELPYLMMTIAGLYHMYRSNFFQVRVHSYLGAIFLAFSILFRPIESCLVLLVPALLYLKRSIDYGSVKRLDVVTALVATVPVISAAVYLYTAKETSTRHGTQLIAVLSLSAAILIFLSVNTLRGTTTFLRSYATFLLISAAWWIPFLDRGFFGWLKRSTNWALVSSSKPLDPSTDPWGFAKRIHQTYLGEALLWLLFATALFSLLLWVLNRSGITSKAVNGEKAQRELDGWFITSLILPHPLIAFMFHNADTRYYIVSASVLLFALVHRFLGLSSSKSYSILSGATILALSIAQGAATLSIWTPHEGIHSKSATLPPVATLFATHYPRLTAQRFTVDRLAEEIYARSKPLGIQELYCVDQWARSYPGSFLAVNLRLHERYPASVQCVGLSKWEGGPVWPTTCAETMHVFSVGDMTKENSGTTDLISSVRAAWRKDRLASWGYHSAEELVLCSPEYPNKCTSFIFALRHCPGAV